VFVFNEDTLHFCGGGRASLTASSVASAVAADIGLGRCEIDKTAPLVLAPLINTN